MENEKAGQKTTIKRAIVEVCAFHGLMFAGATSATALAFVAYKGICAAGPLILTAESAGKLGNVLALAFGGAVSGGLMLQMPRMEKVASAITNKIMGSPHP